MKIVEIGRQADTKNNPDHFVSIFIQIQYILTQSNTKYCIKDVGMQITSAKWETATWNVESSKRVMVHCRYAQLEKWVNVSLGSEARDLQSRN